MSGIFLENSVQMRKTDEMTKTGRCDKNTDFCRNLTKFTIFSLFDKRKNGIFGGKIIWSLFIITSTQFRKAKNGEI